MLINDLILRNPLRLMHPDPKKSMLPVGGFGAVLARAGVGKTALLVQIALNSLLEGRNVLHISLEDPVNKVNLWYEEVLNLICKQYNIRQSQELRETVLPHRFIMTFRVERFSVPKLEERLSDLTEQKIFEPSMVIIDGLPFQEGIRQSLNDLKLLAQRRSCHVWFTVRTHRHEPPDASGMPRQLRGLESLFDIILQLQPEGKDINIQALKGSAEGTPALGLRLDPSTMLITDAG
jgi:hypothetical protein